jgi:TolB-like protein
MRVFEFFVELCRIRNMKVLAAKGVALFEQVAAMPSQISQNQGYVYRYE